MYVCKIVKNKINETNSIKLCTEKYWVHWLFLGVYDSHYKNKGYTYLNIQQIKQENGVTEISAHIVATKTYL